MTLQLIGAGLPRTGTMSLKRALEQLTGGPCYHMHEVFLRPDHPALWTRVFDGEVDLIDKILAGFTAAFDWPCSAAWTEVVERYPDAPVLLSHRGDAETWWESANRTVWEVMRGNRSAAPDDWWEMNSRILERFAPYWDDEASAKAAYECHLHEVRAAVPSTRLYEYQPGDGWEPLCRALGLAIPTAPFPHINSAEEFMDRRKQRELGSS